MNHEPTADRSSADERAAFAVLDMALAERLGATAPPDLWPAVAARAAAGPAARTGAGWSWLVAALALLGLGLVATMLVTREPLREAASRPTDLADPSLAAMFPGDAAPGGPRSLAELQQRLADASEATLRARGLWSAGTQWVALPRVAWDEWLRRGLRPELHDDDRRLLVAALGNATRTAPCRDVVWTHDVTLRCGEAAVPLVLQTGGPGAPRVAFRSPDGAVEILDHGVPFATLHEQLDELTRTTVATLGFVVGEHGFDAVPTTATSLRLLAVPARAATALARYTKLTQIDLTASPECHRTDVLRLLSERSLHSVQASPEWLAADAYPLLASLRGLRELFLCGGDAMRVYFGLETPPAAPGLDDRALAALARSPSLHELALGGGSFGDDALRAFADGPLEKLALIDCARVRGSGLAPLRQLRNLLLRGTSFDRDVLAHVAPLPQLRDLVVFVPGRDLDLSPLVHAKCEPLLSGAIARAELAHLPRCAGLRKLALQLEPPLRDDELVLLHGLTQLERLKVASPLVTKAGLDALRAALPKCTIGGELY